MNEYLVDGMTSVLQDRYDKGVLPDKFVKYKDGDIPTVRSCVKALPGWCMVESDYQTAEMRGLAYISRDYELIKLIEEPDQCFAYVAPEYLPEGIKEEDCVCRISFPESLGDTQGYSQYLLTYTVNGTIKGKFTEAMLLRNDAGEIQSPKYDMHWGTIEMARKSPREVLHKKKDRGAGKVGNFCCAGSTLVLCKTRGFIPITDVITSDLVWDGEEWVSHEGVICHGVNSVLPSRLTTLETTPDHIVWVKKGARNVSIPILDALMTWNPIVRTAKDDGTLVPVLGSVEKVSEAALLRQKEIRALIEGKAPLIDDCPSLRGRSSEYLLQRTEVVTDLAAFSVGLGGYSKTVAFQEFLTCPESRMSREEVVAALADSELSYDALKDWIHTPSPILRAALFYSVEEWLIRSFCSKVPVYDLVNAGPRNRFTANGYLISNSSTYGASPTSIERKIEADIGFKPEEGTGQAILDAIESRQKRASAFLKEMENVPEQVGYYRAASGRIRHFTVLADSITGLSSRTRSGQISALGRECRNFPMQESVASTVAYAGNWLLAFKRQTGLQGYPMIILYDSVVTHCPIQERKIWSLAHTLYMYMANGWRYGDLILRYPIDTEINGGWSTEEKNPILHKALQDPTWQAPQEKWQPVINWLEEQIHLYESNPALSVHNTVG